MTRTRLLAATVAGVLLSLLVPDPVLADDSRVDRIRAAVAETDVYLEPATALGELEVWRARLQDALAEVRLDVPVRVALWTSVPGLAPLDSDLADDPAKVRRQLGLGGGIALTDQVSGGHMDDEAVSDEQRRRVQALDQQTQAVAEKLVEAAGDESRYRSLSPVARAWVWLRLAGQEVPRPRDLVAELAGDPGLLADSAVAPELDKYYGNEDSDLIDPLAIAVAVIVLLGTAAVFLLRWRREHQRTGSDLPPLVRSRLAAELTDLQLEREVADLAEAIARSDVRPGSPDYDRAQAHLDAATRYVDSQLDRERVGCHLLTRDGRTLLQGKIVAARCFFNPEHYSEAWVGKGEVRVSCCLQCAAALRAGRRPPALVVADQRGELAPYYDTHDVWTRTGYGSLPGNWARRALLDSLTRTSGVSGR